MADDYVDATPIVQSLEDLIRFAHAGLDAVGRDVANGLTSDLHALLESRLRAYLNAHGSIAPAASIVALARLLRATILSATGAMDVKVTE